VSRNGHVKAKRQQAILGLVANERLATQEEIRSRLAYLGIDATQSTISRDIDELGLARAHDPQGLRYVASGDAGSYGPMALLRPPWPRAWTARVSRTSPGRSRATTPSSSSVARAWDRPRWNGR